MTGCLDRNANRQGHGDAESTPARRGPALRLREACATSQYLMTAYNTDRQATNKEGILSPVLVQVGRTVAGMLRTHDCVDCSFAVHVSSAGHDAGLDAWKSGYDAAIHPLEIWQAVKSTLEDHTSDVRSTGGQRGGPRHFQGQSQVHPQRTLTWRRLHEAGTRRGGCWDGRACHVQHAIVPQAKICMHDLSLFQRGSVTYLES